MFTRIFGKSKTETSALTTLDKLNEGSDILHAAKRVPDQAINFMYIGKIVIAFILIFVLGAILTLVLENVPRLIELLERYV
ncbi:hypothetical protein ACLB2K_004811 [Fragaria x ananassa]